ncbi:MAG: DUF5677 domain-containing protein [Candidatus Saccharibacteria bacterium]|nr:DUF5677 domain-containing protein [Candidatus Saccharibacteria bacterium]
MSNEENKLLDDLGALISGLLEAYEDWRASIKSAPPSEKTVAATSCLFVALKQADGIKILIEKNRLESAMILLRPLIEIYVNCAYIFISEDKSNMIRFMYSSDKDALDNTKKYKKFVNETYTKPKYTEAMFNVLIKKYEASINEISELGYPLKKMPDFRSRCEMVQKYTGCPDFGELYFNSYLLLCDTTHVSASSIAEVSVSEDFKTRWHGRESLGRRKDTLSITNGIISSMVIFLEKNANIKLKRNQYFKGEIIKKYNRYIEYDELKQTA